MNKRLLAFVCLAGLAFQCGVAKKQASGNCIQGKVIRISCASYVVQSLNVDTVGQDGWKNSADTTIAYDNVFDVANKCKLPADLKAGDTIYFTAAPVQASDCISCMMFDAPPAVKYDLNNVSRKPCE